MTKCICEAVSEFHSVGEFYDDLWCDYLVLDESGTQERINRNAGEHQIYLLDSMILDFKPIYRGLDELLMNGRDIYEYI